MLSKSGSQSYSDCSSAACAITSRRAGFQPLQTGRLPLPSLSESRIRPLFCTTSAMACFAC
jgi:hypothetical protein